MPTNPCDSTSPIWISGANCGSSFLLLDASSSEAGAGTGVAGIGIAVGISILLAIGGMILFNGNSGEKKSNEETISIHLTEELFSSEKTYQPEICIICLEEFNLDKSITT